jgi:hypothetical protein
MHEEVSWREIGIEEGWREADAVAWGTGENVGLNGCICKFVRRREPFFKPPLRRSFAGLARKMPVHSDFDQLSISPLMSFCKEEKKLCLLLRPTSARIYLLRCFPFILQVLCRSSILE